MSAVGARFIIFEPLGGAFDAENVFPVTIELDQLLAGFKITHAYRARFAYIRLVGSKFPELITFDFVRPVQVI